MRFGYGFYGTYRQFFKEDMAVEGLAGFRDNGMNFTALREYFLPVLTEYSSSFKFYYGYGVHAGFSYTNKFRILNREYRHDYMFTPLFGVDGIFGLEYYVSEMPLMFSADLKPFFEYSINRYFNIQLELSFTVKYRF